MAERRTPVVLLTDVLWERIAEAARREAPGIEPVLLRTAAPPAPDDLARVDVACLSGDAYPERVREVLGATFRASALRWFHTFSAGVDSPVFAGFLERGIRLTNSSGSSAPSIARTVIMTMLALSRDLPRWTVAQRETRWAPHRFHDVVGQRLLVVGWGPIGQEVARLGHALGLEVEIARRAAHGDEGYPVCPLDHLEEGLARADWVVVALPLTAATRQLFDARRLAVIRPGARFVNVGRGELVDEDALVDALRSGALAGAGLDVFATEPLPPTSALWSLPNVIVTPHASGLSELTEERGASLFVQNLGRYTRDEPLLNEVARAGV